MFIGETMVIMMNPHQFPAEFPVVSPGRWDRCWSIPQCSAAALGCPPRGTDTPKILGLTGKKKIYIYIITCIKISFFMGLPCFASQIGENAGFSGIICDFTGNEWWFER